MDADEETKQEVEQIPQQINLDDKRKLIFVLEQAPLEVAKFKNRPELLNSNDHKTYISKKLNQTYSKYRPDITHQCLLTILDSPLNKAGMMDVYIRTEKNVLIHVNPATKIPRTYSRFAKLFAQLLLKLKIRAQESSELLLHVVKNPITNHIPANAIKIGTSVKARLVKIKEFVPKLSNNAPIVFVVGAVAKGDPAVECDYLDDCICISRYGLSAANCISKIVNTFEDHWDLF